MPWPPDLLSIIIFIAFCIIAGLTFLSFLFGSRLFGMARTASAGGGGVQEACTAAGGGGGAHRPAHGLRGYSARIGLRSAARNHYVEGSDPEYEAWINRICYQEKDGWADTLNWLKTL